MWWMDRQIVADVSQAEVCTNRAYVEWNLKWCLLRKKKYKKNFGFHFYNWCKMLLVIFAWIQIMRCHSTWIRLNNVPTEAQVSSCSQTYQQNIYYIMWKVDQCHDEAQAWEDAPLEKCKNLLPSSFELTKKKIYYENTWCCYLRLLVFTDTHNKKKNILHGNCCKKCIKLILY